MMAAYLYFHEADNTPYLNNLYILILNESILDPASD